MSGLAVTENDMEPEPISVCFNVFPTSDNTDIGLIVKLGLTLPA